MYVKSWKEHRSKLKYENEENVKKKKSLMPGSREERMQEGTVRRGPFGYAASKTWNEDVLKESLQHF